MYTIIIVAMTCSIVLFLSLPKPTNIRGLAFAGIGGIVGSVIGVFVAMAVGMAAPRIETITAEYYPDLITMTNSGPVYFTADKEKCGKYYFFTNRKKVTITLKRWPNGQDTWGKWKLGEKIRVITTKKITSPDWNNWVFFKDYTSKETIIYAPPGCVR